MPPVPPRKSRTGLTILVVLLGVLLLFCCTPVGIVGGRYLAMENGPHKALPDICAVVDDDALTSIVGDTEGRGEHEAGDSPYVSCRWAGETRTNVSMSATLYHKTPLDSSLTRARDLYRFGAKSDARPSSTSTVAVGPLNGVGQDGQCAVRSIDGVNVEFRCVARDGNVVLDVDVSPPLVDPDKVPQSQHLATAKLSDLVAKFTHDVAGKLMNDLVEDLD
jgi:hypothetical protein